MPYLARLGISHVYASPYLMCRPGSTHGYDIVDHNALNPELGDEPAFSRLVLALRAHHLGQILQGPIAWKALLHRVEPHQYFIKQTNPVIVCAGNLSGHGATHSQFPIRKSAAQ